jgi:FlaA1/EpsC-like NDP-sugar epimerase
MAMHEYSSHSTGNFLFAFFDGLFIMGSVAASDYLLWGDEGVHPFITESLQYKGMAFVFIIQIAFYYFDLYEFRSLQHRIKMGLQLLEALLASAICLSILYYFMPFVGIGRKIFLFSFGMIFVLTFSLRFFSPWITKNNLFKERILIVGTGAWAQKIAEEIRKNSPDSFEIVGFVEEKRENVGKAI